MSSGDIPKNEQDWDKLARANGYRCGVCDQLIPFSERVIYFERKLCGHCAYKLDKKD
jgi:hypothetical protein